MATIQSGTRTLANLQLGVKAPTRKFDRGYTRDVGMTKRAVGALSFNTGAANVTLAGLLGAFAYNDTVLVEGTVSNNGFFLVGSTGANTLGLIPAPVSEVAPATASIRAA